MSVEVNLTAPITPEPRKLVRAENSDLAVAWVGAALAGAVLISLLPESIGVLRSAVPLMVMIGYAVFAMNRSLRNTPKIADSVYFMGFLWTLWALIDVLVFSEQLTAAQLYLAFGYALIATAFGMFIRLTMLQFFRTADDQEIEATDGIDTRVAKLTSELDTAIASISRFRMAASKELTASAHKVQERLSGLEAAIGECADRLSATNEKVPSAVSALAGVVLQGTASLATAHQDLVNKVRLIDCPPDLIKGAVRSATSELETLSQSLKGSLGAAISGIEASVRQVENAAQSLAANQGIATASQHLVRSLSASASTCDAATKALSDATQAVTALKGALGQFQAVAGDTTDRTAQSAAGLQAQLGLAAGKAANVEANIQRVDRALRDVVDFVQRMKVN